MSLMLLMAVFILTACTGDDDEFPAAEGFQEPGATATAVPAGDDDTDASDDTAASDDPDATMEPSENEGGDGAGQDASGATNVFPAGEAGEVELALDGDRLVLVEVRPSAGWSHRVDEDDDDEIEIDFHDNGREIDFEAELDDGRLKVDVCDISIVAAGDVYSVGEAGEVEIRQSRDDDDDDDDDDDIDLELVKVRVNDGWSYEVEKDDDDEIEVVFHRGEERVKFDLESDDGWLEARTCTRTVVEVNNGQFPATASPAGDDHHDDDDDDHHDDDD